MASFAARKCSIKAWLRYYSSRESHFKFHESFNNAALQKLVTDNFQLHLDFITEHEENTLFIEVEKTLKRLRYESDHWDAAIVGYRETEKKDWTLENDKVLNRIKTTAFPAPDHTLPLVHVLDLKAEGEIKPHVDSIKFCGSTIAGLSILSDAVMRLTHTDLPDYTVDILLPRRSLYIMASTARYQYNHAVLPPASSIFDGRIIEKTRRISIMCRNHPINEA